MRLSDILSMRSNPRAPEFGGIEMGSRRSVRGPGALLNHRFRIGDEAACHALAVCKASRQYESEFRRRTRRNSSASADTIRCKLRTDSFQSNRSFWYRLPIPPVNLRVALVGRFNLGWYKRIPDPLRAREHVLRIRSCLLHRCAGSFGRHAAKGANLGPDQIARRLAMIGADLDHQLPASSTPGGRPRRMLDRE